jgi:translation initiation factor 2 alpha subunit (eIF-2alpha)
MDVLEGIGGVVFFYKRRICFKYVRKNQRIIFGVIKVEKRKDEIYLKQAVSKSTYGKRLTLFNKRPSVAPFLPAFPSLS